MTKMNRAVTQTAGAREADVVGPKHLEHFGAHQSHDQRELKNRQRDGGENDVFPASGAHESCAPPADLDGVAAAKARQPAKVDGKNQDQQDADQKRRE